MTLGGFIEFLLDNDCEIARDYDCEVLQIKRKGSLGSQLKTTYPYSDKKDNVRAMTACRICHSLGVPVPSDLRQVEQVLLGLLEMHKKQQDPDQ